jgi:hypothetical protein
MSNKSIREVVKIAKSCDSFGDYKLADKFSNLLENYRYAQSQKLTLDNFVDSLFNFVDRNNLRDLNGNVSFVTAFDRYSYFGANIDGVSISQIPQLVNLRNTVLRNPGKRYMPNDLKGLLSGAGENNNNNNNILVSNNPTEFATKLFQFARNNNFSNLTRALESYMGNAFYSGMQINNNKPFMDLFNRVKQTNSVITESMLSNELSMILGGNVGDNNNVSSMGNNVNQGQNNSSYSGSDSYDEMVGIIEKSSISGLDSLVTYIDNDRFLTPEEKLKLKNIIEARKSYLA